MKLLFDENLPPRLVAALTDAYPGSLHVHYCGLGSVTILRFGSTPGTTVVRSSQRILIFRSKASFAAIHRKSFGFARLIALAQKSSISCGLRSPSLSASYGTTKYHVSSLGFASKDTPKLLGVVPKFPWRPSAAHGCVAFGAGLSKRASSTGTFA